MANEEKKDFYAMLHDSKDMPKYPGGIEAQKILVLQRRDRNSRIIGIVKYLKILYIID